LTRSSIRRHAGELQQKIELALRKQLRLIELTASDVGRLRDVFAEWLALPAGSDAPCE
jgi:hypothetical protein